MSDIPPYKDQDQGADRRRMPRWAWLSAVAAAIVVLIIITVMLGADGGHPRPDHGFGGDRPATDATDLRAEQHTPRKGAHR